jgi:hypothetical protein
LDEWSLIMSETDSKWYSYHFFYSGDRNIVLLYFFRPAVSALRSEDCIDSFFFIRYPLGGPHVRLRLRVLPGQFERVEGILTRLALEFFDRWPSTAAMSQDGRVCLAGVIPQDQADPAGYPDNALLRFSFEPETERYGGESLLPVSLDFFFVSSIVSLGFVTVNYRKPWASQLPRAMSMLVQQAWGFADDEGEFLDLFAYRLPVWKTVAESVCDRGDKVFEAQREVFRSLLMRELTALSCDTPTLYAEASQRLAWEIRAADPGVRRQIGTSQIHMTANRLGLSNPDEIYLGRIVCRAIHEIAEVEPDSWGRLVEFLASRKRARAQSEAPLSELLPAFWQGLPRGLEGD